MGGMKCLLLLLCAGVTVSSAVDLQKRVIHGKPCGNAERGYHVKLIGFNGTHESLCGGSLISDSYVLTATHCWEDGWEMTAFVGVHPGPPDPPQGVKITEHHIYNDTKGNHDIMLLKLEKPIQTSTKIAHINLPSDQECVDRHQLTTVQVAGHAATKTRFWSKKRGNDKPTKLHCGDVPVVDCTDFKNCLKKSTHPVAKSTYYQEFFCGKTDKVDIAPGDSGGGVVNNCRIYGVISFSRSKYACKAPAGFMDVCFYKSWIEGIVKP